MMLSSSDEVEKKRHGDETVRNLKKKTTQKTFNEESFRHDIRENWNQKTLDEIRVITSWKIGFGKSEAYYVQLKISSVFCKFLAKKNKTDNKIRQVLSF